MVAPAPWAATEPENHRLEFTSQPDQCGSLATDKNNIKGKLKKFKNFIKLKKLGSHHSLGNYQI